MTGFGRASETADLRRHDEKAGGMRSGEMTGGRNCSRQQKGEREV